MKIIITLEDTIRIKTEDVQACDLIGKLLPVIKSHVSLVAPEIGARRAEHIIVDAIEDLGMSVFIWKQSSEGCVVIVGVDENEIQ
jgi:hypothetical protein